jgi:hypothetical protein
MRDQLTEKLMELPGLLELYRQEHPSFLEKTVDWHARVEELLKRLRKAEVGKISSQKARILSVKDACRSSKSGEKPASVRKLERVTANEALQTSEAVLSGMVQHCEEQLASARQEIHKLVSLSLTARGTLPEPIEPHQRWLETVWASLPVDANTRLIFNYVSLSVKPLDRLFLLDEALGNVG